MERLKQLCSLPGQLMDHMDARWSTFLSDNALVADPEAELAGDWLGKNWSQEEKRIFMDKYLQYPKVRGRVCVRVWDWRQGHGGWCWKGHACACMLFGTGPWMALVCYMLHAACYTSLC
jgi:hypothetical protein